MKKFLAFLLAALLVGALLVGCGNDGIVTEEQAKKIALKEVGLKESQVDDIHIHMVEENGLPCYSVHITTPDTEMSVVIDIASGEILN